MTSNARPQRPGATGEFSRAFLLVAAGVLLFRLAQLLLSAAELGPDEAQYWFWSLSPAFGYFSKPPLIAWIIAATTSLFGNAEWAVRLAAPVFQTGAAVLLYLVSANLYDRRAAFWVGVTWLFVPGVILSSLLMTTDAPLLFFWSLALLSVTRLVASEKPDIKSYILLGCAVGLGFLSKYAMVYFPLALGGACFVDARIRRRIVTKESIIAIFIAAIIIAPNVWWNAAHDMSTLSHTAANANWGGAMFHPVSALTFFIEQFGVAGLVPVGAFIWLAYSRLQIGAVKKIAAHEVLLFFFALTPLLIVFAQAFISRAHANWAAAAYPAIIILTTPHLIAAQKVWIVKANVALYAAASVVFAIFAIQPAAADLINFSKATREIRGWADQSAIIASQADGFDAIAIDDRSMMGAMLYYNPELTPKIVAIDPNASVDHHYEAFKAFDPAKHKRMLFVTTRDDDAHVEYRFGTVIPLGAATVTFGLEERTYHLFEISDYFGPTPSTL